MDVEALFRETLAPLPWPISQWPGYSDQKTYLVFTLAGESVGSAASNNPTRLRHLVQLHAYSTDPHGEHRTAFNQARQLLRARGVRIYATGPDEYEKDTGRYHIAATCEWRQAVNKEETT